MTEKKRRKNPPYFGLPKPIPQKEYRIQNEELFSSLKTEGPLEGIATAAGSRKTETIAEIWSSYMSGRAQVEIPDPLLHAPLSEKEIINEADMIIRNKIVAWGRRRTTFGDEINFISFAGGHRQLELHRLAFLSYLGKAHDLNNQQVYVRAFEKIISCWMVQCEKTKPTAVGHPIWCHSGCGVRILSVIPAYESIRRFRETSKDLHRKILKLTLGHSRWLARSLGESCAGGSGFDACAALILSGCYYPELHESRDWIERGLASLSGKCQCEYCSDGGYAEMSDEHALKALDRIIFARKLLADSPEWKGSMRKLDEYIETAAEYFARTCTPLGTTCPFNESSYTRLAARLTEVASLLKRWDLLYPVRDYLDPDTARKAKKPSWGPSINLPESGRAIMRTGWGRDDLYLCAEYSSPDDHSHSETTNFAVFAHGSPMIVERGGGSTRDDPYDLFLRTSRLHSMIVLGDDNIDLESKRGEVDFWESGDKYDCLALRHFGYKRKYDAVITRLILFVKPEYWIICDTVQKPKRSVKAVSYLHTLPVLFVEEDGVIRCRQAPGFVLATPRDEKKEFLKERAVANMAELDNEMRWTDWIGFEKRAALGKGTTFMAVIHPYRDAPMKLEVRRQEVLPAKGGKPVEPVIAESFRISTPGSTDHFFISHAKPAKRRYGEVTSDGAAGIIRTGADGNPTGFLIVNGSTLELSGKALAKYRKKHSFLEKQLQ